MEFSFFKNPVRFRIALELIDKPEGISIMQLGKLLKDVPQATLYRQVKSMLDDGLIMVTGVQKLDKRDEKLYTLNTREYRVSDADWNKASNSEKLKFVSFFFMYIVNSYKNYLSASEVNSKNDKSTFSISKLMLTDEEFNQLQSDFNKMLTEYYRSGNKENSKERTVSLVIIP